MIKYNRMKQYELQDLVFAYISTINISNKTALNYTMNNSEDSTKPPTIIPSFAPIIPSVDVTLTDIDIELLIVICVC